MLHWCQSDLIMMKQNLPNMIVSIFFTGMVLSLLWIDSIYSVLLSFSRYGTEYA